MIHTVSFVIGLLLVVGTHLLLIASGQGMSLAGALVHSGLNLLGALLMTFGFFGEKVGL